MREPTSLSDSCPECGAPIVGGRQFVYCTGIERNTCSYAIAWADYVEDKQMESRMLRGDFDAPPDS